MCGAPGGPAPPGPSPPRAPVPRFTPPGATPAPRPRRGLAPLQPPGPLHHRGAPCPAGSGASRRGGGGCGAQLPPARALPPLPARGERGLGGEGALLNRRPSQSARPPGTLVGRGVGLCAGLGAVVGVHRGGGGRGNGPPPAAAVGGAAAVGTTAVGTTAVGTTAVGTTGAPAAAVGTTAVGTTGCRHHGGGRRGRGEAGGGLGGRRRPLHVHVHLGGLRILLGEQDRQQADQEHPGDRAEGDDQVAAPDGFGLGPGAGSGLTLTWDTTPPISERRW